MMSLMWKIMMVWFWTERNSEVGDLHVQIEPRGTLHYEDPLVGDD